MKQIGYYLVILLCLSFTLPTQAQEFTQTIRGKIIDSQSEAPLIGASVVVVDSEPIKGASSNVKGEFTITDVPIGRVTLKVSYIGYEDTYIPGVLVSSGKQPFITAKMKESFTQMDEVVVVATDNSSGEPLNEMASVSALSFSVEQTSRYAATFDDPARAALAFAGVSTGGDDVVNEIVIRGNSPRGLLWRIEGVEIPNPNHFADIGSSAGGISMLSSSMLANSDFFIGAFPAEYGNAASGVFDIYLRNGNNEKREYAFQAGLLGLAGAIEGPFSKGGKSSYLVNYRYSTLTLFDNLGIDVTGEEEDIVFSDLSFKLNFPTEKAGVFSIWGLGGSSTEDGRSASVESGRLFNEYAHNELGIIGLNHTIFLNKDTYLESSITGSSRVTEYKEDSLNIRPENEERFTERAIRFSTLLNKKINTRNTVRAGTIFSYLDFNLFSGFYIRDLQRLTNVVDEDGNTEFIQAYLQWQYRVTEQLTLNTGFHYSQLLLNNNSSFEPRLGLKYQIRPDQSLNFGFGIHSRRETTSIYLATAERPDGSIAQPNKDLELMKAAHFVAGYQRKLGDKWKFKTEAYYQYLYDVPIRASVNNDSPFAPFVNSFSLLNISGGLVNDTLTNEGTGRNYGIEFTLERSLKKGLYIVATNSIFQSKYTALDGIERNTRYNANYLFNITTGKEWKVGKNKQNILSLNGKFILSGNNRVTPIDLQESRARGFGWLDTSSFFEESLNDYWRFDFGIRYIKNRPKMTSIIALNVQNLTGRENESGRFFNSFTNQIESDTQLGLFPNLSYRIEF